MENVIEFPTREVRNWAIVERSLRAGLREVLAVSPAVEARLVEKMRAFFNETLRLQFQFTITDFTFQTVGSMSNEQKEAFRSSLGEKISSASEEVIQDFTKRLFIERLDCE